MPAQSIAVLALAASALAGCGSSTGPSRVSASVGSTPPTPASTSTRATVSSAATTAPARFAITSPDFPADGPIPRRFTCDGADVSPALSWTGVPAGTAALALVVDDPDAPNGTFTHWVVADLPPAATGSAQGRPPQGGREVRGDSGRATYLGPCPPSGTHHYRFTLYALRAPIGAAADGPLASVVAAIHAAATAEARVVGTYHR